MAMKAKHAFGNLADVEQALLSGKINSYDILFLDGDSSPKIGWIDANGIFRLVENEADFSELEAIIATKADADEVEAKLAEKVGVAEVNEKVETAMSEKMEEIDARLEAKVDAEEVDAKVETAVSGKMEEVSARLEAIVDEKVAEVESAYEIIEF